MKVQMKRQSAITGVRGERQFSQSFLESRVETGATVGPVDLPLTYQEKIIALRTVREMQIVGNIDAGRACVAPAPLRNIAVRPVKTPYATPSVRPPDSRNSTPRHSLGTRSDFGNVIDELLQLADMVSDFRKVPIALNLV